MAWIFLKIGLQKYYWKLWNPINYFTIGGIGVLINFLVLFLLHGTLGLNVYVVNVNFTF